MITRINYANFNFTNSTATKFAGAVCDRPRANKVRPLQFCKTTFLGKSQFAELIKGAFLYAVSCHTVQTIIKAKLHLQLGFYCFMTLPTNLGGICFFVTSQYGCGVFYMLN